MQPNSTPNLGDRLWSIIKGLIGDPSATAQISTAKNPKTGQWSNPNGAVSTPTPPYPQFTSANATPSPTPQVLANAQQMAPQMTPQGMGIPGFNTKRLDPQLANLVINSAKQNGVDPAVLASLLFTESGIQPSTRDTILKDENGNVIYKQDGTPARDRGIAQISDIYNPGVTDQQAYDPNFAIPWAAQKLASDNKYFGGDWNKTVAAYNVGRGGASIQGKNPYGGGPKGQKYINAVTQNLDPNLVKQYGFKSGPVIPYTGQ